MKTKYWNWSETLDIVVPVGLLLAVAVAKKQILYQIKLRLASNHFIAK